MNKNKSTKEKSCLLIIIIIIIILKNTNLKYNILSLILFILVFALNDRG